MIVHAPEIFREFHCVGSQCRDNCCRMGWDIEIDHATYELYRSLDCGLCEHISSEGGEHYIKQENGQCPFLNKEGLCSVLLEHGVQSISQICDRHPRFYQWFGGYKEAGTGLCCEESARLWLESAGSIRFCDFETDEEDDDLEFDGGLLDAVIRARDVLIGLLQSSLTLSQKMKALLIFALNAQDSDGSAEDFNELAQEFADCEKVALLAGRLGGADRNDVARACENVLDYLAGLDYMKELFPSVLGQIRGRSGEIIDSAKGFDEAFPEAEGQLCAVAVYNVYRYFTECARGAEALPRLAMCAVNVWLIRLWDIMLFKDGKFGFSAQVEAVKEFSKEVEYSDNVESFYEDIYMDGRLCADNLVKITEV